MSLNYLQYVRTSGSEKNPLCHCGNLNEGMLAQPLDTSNPKDEQFSVV